jgi:hypothetical protein
MKMVRALKLKSLKTAIKWWIDNFFLSIKPTFESQLQYFFSGVLPQI